MTMPERKNAGGELKSGQIPAELVRASRLQSRRPRLDPTGLAALDARLGGFVRGEINEVVAPGGGAEAILYAALAAAIGCGGRAALVDAGDGFDPESAQAAGVAGERLLWIRSRGAQQALRAAEMLLGLGGLDTVAVALEGLARAGRLWGAAPWLRLKRAARSSEAVLLVSGPASLAGQFAAVRIRLCAWRARWSPSAPSAWLEGVEFRLRIERGPPWAIFRDFWVRIAA